MTFPLAVALAIPLLLAGGAVARDVQPRAGVVLSGAIQFPRTQEMTFETDPRDGSKVTVRLGFDGRCDGGGLGEAWASLVEARPVVRVRGGGFSANLMGTLKNFGGERGREARFKWKLSGRFTAADAATATVSGSAEVRKGRRVVARCRIARPAAVKLALR